MVENDGGDVTRVEAVEHNVDDVTREIGLVVVA